MNKTLIKLGAGLIFVVLALGIAVGILISRIDPNQFIPTIQQQVLDKTGASLNLKQISWKFWPSLQLELQEVSLATNAPSHENLIAFEVASVEVQVVPLLRQQLRVNHLTLQKPTIWFHQYPEGTHNWQPLLDGLQPNAQEETPVNTEPSPTLDMAVEQIEISEGVLYVTGTDSITISPLNLNVKNIAFSAPIEATLQAIIEMNSQTLDVSADSIILIDQGITALDIQDIALSIQGEQPEQNLTLQGKSRINLTSQAITSEVTVKPVNMDAWLSILPTEALEEQSPTEVPSESPTPESTPLPLEMLKTLQVKSLMTLEEVTYNKTPHSLQLEVSADNGLIAMNNVVLKAYGGEAKGQVQLNAKPAIATLAVNLDVNNMGIDTILNTWMNVRPIKGNVNSKIDVKTQGNTVEALVESLAGNTELSMIEAALPTVNFHDLLWTQLQSKQGSLITALDQFPTLKKDLGTLKTPKVLRESNALADLFAQFQVSPEVVSSNTINGTLNDQAITGQFNYYRQTEKVAIETALKLPFSNPDLANIVWPLSCDGSLNGEFGCSVDSSALKPILKQLAKDEAKEKLNEKLAPSKEKAKKELREVEDTAKDKIEEKLGRSLKDLFKKE